MTPPDRPLPVHARPGSRTGGNPGGNPGGDSAGELLWWALRAVNVHDLVVFPVRSGGKTPAVRGWQHVATQDRAQLRRWFREQRWNIGIATGASGLLVIDLDDGHGHAPPPRWRSARHGRDVFTRLAAEAGEPIPTTYTVATPSGSGLHLYFRQPAQGPLLRNTQGKLGWCIDTRGEGGFVVAAGSRRSDGRRYRVVTEAPIAPLPRWIARLLTPAPPAPPPPPILLASHDAVTRRVRGIVAAACARAGAAQPGRRHAELLTAARICGQLVGGGALEESAAVAALYAATAHHIGVHGCTRREIERTVTDGLAYGRRSPRIIDIRPRR